MARSGLVIPGVVLSVGVLVFSWTVATFPGEWQEERLADLRFAPVRDASEPSKDKPSEPKAMALGDWIVPSWAGWAGNWLLAKEVSLHGLIFKSPVDPTTRRRRLPFSSTLV